MSGSAASNGARLVLATHNKGKLKELRELLRGQVAGLDVDTQVVDAAAAGAPDVAETGVTFAENSLLKARAVAEATGLIAIADDSGLAVDVLGGAPGIFSARWSGKHGDDVANLQLLLAQLSDVPDAARGAAFICAAALAVPAEDGIAHETVEYGQLEGTLLREPRGGPQLCRVELRGKERDQPPWPGFPCLAAGDREGTFLSSDPTAP